jgi:hypothetical protein
MYRYSHSNPRLHGNRLGYYYRLLRRSNHYFELQRLAEIPLQLEMELLASLLLTEALQLEL